MPDRPRRIEGRHWPGEVDFSDTSFDLLSAQVVREGTDDHCCVRPAGAGWLWLPEAAVDRAAV